MVFMAAVIGINVFAQNPASDFEYTLNDTADGLTITKYKGTAATVVIPGEIEGFPVTEIGYPAFFRNNLVKVTIPEGVTTLGSAFRECRNLVEVNLPQTLVTIEDGAFASCEKLESIVIPEGVLNFGASVFSHSGLTHIILPPNMTSIPPEMFERTQLTQIIIPEGVTFIASAAFADCTKLTTIKLPSTLQIIGSVDFSNEGRGGGGSIAGAFENCKALTAILVPDTIKQIEFYIEPGIYYNESGEEHRYQRDADHFAGCSSLSLREQAKLRNLGYKGRF
jgi:hypothetical protein